ncbi:PREDICTED: protocadherin gamma-B3-like [Sturnus vulgaris]|uniref:protocadherin gamma-B3-like n=1 Tax=Sturnus vulgaris TaxID=9172 RepID=UPI00071A1E03|nr:PREDICTED: protocadherin gamma-B3-like [Sturnus vulgaris]
MCAAGRRWGRRQRALLWAVLLAAWEAAWGQLRYSVPEEMPKGSFVGDVAKDLGLQLPALRDRGFHILDKGRTQYFALHGKTGHLVTAERIDREQLCENVQQCVLRCELIVEGEMQVYGIQVEITDINDNAPNFRDSETELRMSEMTTPGSRFPLPDAHDPDSAAGKKQLKYFTVNEENGNLYVNERLDREEMCGSSATCSVSFEVLVHNPLNVFHVEVAIEDVNDNSPVFSKAALDLEIGEWALPGARFPLEIARDSDVGRNSLLTYQLSSDPSFSLSMKEKPGGKKQPELVLERALDREKKSSIDLVLTAVDSGEPARSGTVQIRINVTDLNDNPPVFSKTVYEAKVVENLPAESLVLQVQATDADVGTNGRVSYSFGNVPDEVLSLFSIDSESGEIRTAGPLDFEEEKKYSFGLQATDGGGLTDHCEVQIDITDENDNAPEITILSLSSPVPEDAPVGTVVAVLNIQDPDSGENGQSYSHDVSLTADSRKSQLRFSASGSCCDTLPARPLPDEPAPLLGDQDPAGAIPVDPSAPSVSREMSRHSSVLSSLSRM